MLRYLMILTLSCASLIAADRDFSEKRLEAAEWDAIYQKLSASKGEVMDNYTKNEFNDDDKWQFTSYFYIAETSEGMEVESFVYGRETGFIHIFTANEDEVKFHNGSDEANFWEDFRTKNGFTVAVALDKIDNEYRVAPRLVIGGSFNSLAVSVWRLPCELILCPPYNPDCCEWQIRVDWRLPCKIIDCNEPWTVVEGIRDPLPPIVRDDLVRDRIFDLERFSGKVQTMRR